MQKNFYQLFKKSSIKSNTQDKITNILLICIPNPTNFPIPVEKFHETFSKFGEVQECIICFLKNKIHNFVKKIVIF